VTKGKITKNRSILKREVLRSSGGGDRLLRRECSSVYVRKWQWEKIYQKTKREKFHPRKESRKKKREGGKRRVVSLWGKRMGGGFHVLGFPKQNAVGRKMRRSDRAQRGIGGIKEAPERA